MAHIFRLKIKDSKRGETQTGWYPHGIYKGHAIDAILDPSSDQEANVNVEVTSVPSPLARMHLFNDAFNVVKSKPEGKSNYHKLVSECLDIWEIIFYWDHYLGLNFQKWNFNLINKLAQSGLSGHKLLGKTLDLYLRKDANKFFDSIDGIYLLTYKKKVFAGSSPFTGFFTGAQPIDLNLSSIDGRKYLGNEYVPIFKRNPDFQLFIYRLHKAYRNIFKEYFVALNEYLEACRAYVSFKNEPDKIPDDYNETDFELNYPEKALDSGRNQISIFKDNSLILVKAPKLDLSSDDFTLKSSKSNSDNPLLLPKRHDLKGWKYVGGEWDNKNIGDLVPISDLDQDISNRVLPKLNLRYPFLTAGDFLSDHLISLPYAINCDKFYCFENKGFNDRHPFHFLLPLKERFFEYFNINDLIENRNGIKLTFTRKETGIIDEEEIQVTLALPTNKGTVKLEKTYSTKSTYLDKSKPIKENTENGFISKFFIGIAIFPFIKCKEDKYNDFYKVALLKGESQKIELEFYKDVTNDKIPSPCVERTPESHYYEIKGDVFDYVKVTLQGSSDEETGATGYFIPAWDVKHVGNDLFTFAIDFGTTNTFVAGMNNKGVGPFSITEDDIQVVRLDKPTVPKYKMSTLYRYEVPLNTIPDTCFTQGDNIRLAKMMQHLAHEFVPSIINSKINFDTDTEKRRQKFDYYFPIRTAGLESTKVSDESGINMLSTFNIAFAYERRLQDTKQNKVFTNLKWHTKKMEDIKRIEYFLSELLYLIRGKVLLNGGNPDKTQLVWFTPFSITFGKIKILENTWNSLYKEIFKNSTSSQPIRLSESEAPFYYRSKDGSLMNSDRPVLSIDIGGGTTDIFVFSEDKPAFGSSCHFGGKAIFGDFNNFQSKKNNGLLLFLSGIVDKKIKDKINSAVDENEKNYWAEIDKINNYELSHESTSDSENILSFYLNISDLEIPKFIQISVPNLKFVFLFYFSALHYYCAKLMKAHGLKSPNDICLSGNGSKMLNILESIEISSYSGTGLWIREIYARVYDDADIPNIIFHASRHPKEDTCFGGLLKVHGRYNKSETPVPSRFLMGENLEIDGQIYSSDTVFGDSVNNDTVNGSPTGKSINYQQLLKAKHISGKDGAPESEYVQFVKLFFGISHKINLNEVFQIKIDREKMQNFLISKHEVWLNEGVKIRMETDALKDDNINETTFFYPVSGAIYFLLKNQELKWIES